jgi:hypothetical protein
MTQKQAHRKAQPIEKELRPGPKIDKKKAYWSSLSPAERENRTKKARAASLAARAKKEEPINLDGASIDSRCWLLLRRLALRGYEPDEARRLAEKIEAGKLRLCDVDEKIFSGEE